VPAPDFNGSDSFTYLANDGALDSNTVTVSITVASVNDEPTIDAIADESVDEDAAQQTVSLSGIGSGAANEAQTLSVTASSSNPGLVPNPTVVYLSPNATGSLKYTPMADQHGTATITVTVTDNGGTAHVGDDDTKIRTLVVTVASVNDEPRAGSIENQVMLSNSSKQTYLRFVSEGPANESAQNLVITATSSNPAVATASVVAYVQGSDLATITVNAGASSCGAAEITVTIKDDGGTANGGDDTAVRTFSVSTYHGSFLSPLKEGTVNLVQKGQVVPVQVSFGCPTAQPGLTPSIQLVKGDYTQVAESDLTPITPTLSVSAADTTGVMRSADSKYIYNMLVPKTSDMTAGTRLTIRVRPLATTSNPAADPLMQIVIEVRK
jgi:hypothetical protein